MSSPQPQMVAQQMTTEAPARVSSEQPRPVQPMSMETTPNMRGGEGEKGVSLPKLLFNPIQTDKTPDILYLHPSTTYIPTTPTK
ncbi:hypothetical protein LI328DRAFT_63656 [Trichoderma asperelloides]|nr:hypothetical protein LI328DRAFT_63656 [Trichoderma asperelloides]